MPADGKITLPVSVAGKVEAATLMNSGTEVPFTISGETLVIDASKITPDPVSTIIQLTLATDTKTPPAK